MIKIEERSKLIGADKYGSCSSCGVEHGVYKISFEDQHNNRCSFSLCDDCLNELGNMIYEKYIKETK